MTMKLLPLMAIALLGLPVFANSVDDAISMAQKGTTPSEIVAWSATAPRSVVTPTDVLRMRDANVPDQAVQNLLRNQIPYSGSSEPTTVYSSEPVYSSDSVYYSDPYYYDGYYGPSVGVGIGFGHGYGRGYYGGHRYYGGGYGGHYYGGHRGSGFSVGGGYRSGGFSVGGGYRGGRHR